jgi:hypothetical protein
MKSLADINNEIQENELMTDAFSRNIEDSIDPEGSRKPYTYNATISSGYSKSDITIQVAFVENNPQTCSHYDEIIAAVVNTSNKNSKTVKTMAFKLGLELLKKYFLGNDLFDEAVKEEIDAFHFQQQDAREKIKLERAKSLYQRDHEKARRYCERHGIDFNQVAYSYTVPMSENKTSQIKQWLIDFFDNSDGTIRVKEIRSIMIDEEIITNSEADWNIAKGIASNLKYSKGRERGTWGK